MTPSDDNATNNPEPTLVLFAEATQLRAIAGQASGLAAIVVRGTIVDGTVSEDDRLAIRQSGCPLLLDNGDPAEAHEFDGLHIDAGASDVRRARNALLKGAMLGAGQAMTRHAALDLGEALPDYVMFGKIARGEQPDDVAALEELIGWWADVVELPSVAVAESREDVTRLLSAGADFIAVNRLVWDDDDPASMLQTLVADAAKVVRPVLEEAGT